MYHKYFQAGNRIKLEIEMVPSNLSFWGIIEDVKEDYIIVGIPGEYAQKDDRKVTCVIPGEAKTCIFETVIKGSRKGKLFLLMPNSEDIQVLQRRKYVRVPINIDVKCHLIGIHDKKIDSNKVFPATVKDISGGGVLLNSNLSLPIETMLVFELNLDNNNLVLTAKVLRNNPHPNDNSRDLGCKFVGISDADRQKIIAYTNKAQLRMKKRY